MVILGQTKAVWATAYKSVSKMSAPIESREVANNSSDGYPVIWDCYLILVCGE